MVTYPSDWEFRNADEICDISTGSGDTKDAVPNGLFPFFVRSKKVERINDFEFEGEAVLTAGDGVGTGKVFHYVDGKFKAHQRVYVLNNFQNFDSRFFYYYFSSAFLGEVEKYTAKSSVDSVRRPMIANMRIPRPSLPEQRAIAQVLSGFDEHLANLDELIAKKKAIRDGALEELITGRTRIADYKDPWVTRSARELLSDVITGGTPSTAIDEYWNGSIPWLSSTEIYQRMVSRPTRSISEKGLENSSAQIAPAGSVLIALAGQGKTRGTSAFLTRDMALNQSLAGLVANETELHREYLLYMLIHRYEELRGLSSGDGGRGGLNKTLLWNLWFTLPSNLQEQCAIAEVLLGMDEEIRLLEEERAKVERLKSGAMDDLLTGRVRLPIEEEVA